MLKGYKQGAGSICNIWRHTDGVSKHGLWIERHSRLYRFHGSVNLGRFFNVTDVPFLYPNAECPAHSEHLGSHLKEEGAPPAHLESVSWTDVPFRKNQ